jgi:hypothetical protein
MIRKPPYLHTLVVAFGLWVCTAHVRAADLVTVQEMQASLAAAEPLMAKTSVVPGAPHIEVVQPRLDHPVSSPTPIQLVFVPSATSVVRPETFKVLYGRLRIDITQRLTQVAKITAEGIHIKEARLPKGNHRLLLSIEDQNGRQGVKLLDFEIK